MKSFTKFFSSQNLSYTNKYNIFSFTNIYKLQKKHINIKDIPNLKDFIINNKNLNSSNGK